MTLFQDLSRKFQKFRIILPIIQDKDEKTDLVEWFVDICSEVMNLLAKSIRHAGNRVFGTILTYLGSNRRLPSIEKNEDLSVAWNSYENALQSDLLRFRLKSYQELKDIYDKVTKGISFIPFNLTPLGTKKPEGAEPINPDASTVPETEKFLNSYIYDYFLWSKYFDAASGLLDDALVSLDWNRTNPEFYGFPQAEGVALIPGGLLKPWWRMMVSLADEDEQNLDLYIYQYLKSHEFESAVEGLEHNVEKDWQLSEEEKLLNWAKELWTKFEDNYSPAYGMAAAQM